jgi:Caspase domain
MSENLHGHALIVGVGADLPVTADDARGVANLLQDPTRCAYPADQVKLLTGKDARRENIMTALEWLARQSQAEPDATAVVFFSGHGLERPAYYLLPFGYDVNDLAHTAISGTEFTDLLRTIRAKKLVVLLDCCHAGGQAEAKALPQSPLPPSVINELGSSSGRVVIASSRKDEVSYTGQPYSVFTVALLEALAGYGTFERDGFARVLDTAMWVGRKVPERTNDRQHPIVKVADLEDNFALAYYAAGGKEPRTLVWAAGAPTLRSGLGAAQMATWQRVLLHYRENLLLIEERMSEYVEFTAIPLQLIRSKRHVEAQIADLERKLGLQ